MGIVTYFLSRIILKYTPPSGRFLHPCRTLSLFGIDNILQTVLPNDFKSTTRKRGQLQVLIKVFCRFPDSKRNRRDPISKLIPPPTHRTDWRRHTGKSSLHFYSNKRISSLRPFFLFNKSQKTMLRFRRLMCLLLALQVQVKHC